MNNVILVGRLAQDPKLLNLEGDKQLCFITLAVSRNYKNTNGEYEADFLDIKLWNNIAENTTEFCKKGDLVGVRAHLQNNISTDEEGKITDKDIEIIADKITFLSSVNKAN